MTIERDDAIFYTGIFLGLFAAAFASFVAPLNQVDFLIFISELILLMSLIVLWIVWTRLK